MARKIEEPGGGDGGDPGKGQCQGAKGGARPRTRNGQAPTGARNPRATAALGNGEDEASSRERSFRRRLDSLNLDLPATSPASSSPSPTTTEAPDGGVVFTTSSSSSSSWGLGMSFPSFGGYGDLSAGQALASAPPQMAETQTEGQELYLHFFHERARTELGPNVVEAENRALSGLHDHSAHLGDECGLGAAACAGQQQQQQFRPRKNSMNLQNFQNPVWRQTGRALQRIAEDFAQSRERERVRSRASQVDITSLDYQTFMAMLRELFQGGEITRERIIVLFFFCSDVALEALRRNLDGAVANLTRWAIEFIRDKVCSWVQAHGGWSAVLRQGVTLVQQLAVIGMCLCVGAAAAIYVKRNLR